ncbi:TonB-dependent siderophore receptor [Alcanivorax balearicus MACL04]|uniref:TonB-dependent siderophore receptor n=1 Tax=Alloalcanivorax balearicus MACL04 TaxID=1177182 RepID=A0ABT2R0V9_9GAMM|nr:TonB-dependent siderophore receptor [Alloalcanivorax balearicus]MCU5783396.1 TonB-dependent siderophore receptor [Alloalcanivorax balearicus MACL04]
MLFSSSQRPGDRHWRRRALASMLALTLGCGPALAADSVQTPPSTALRDIRIDAGPLAPALSRFAQQTGITLSFSPDLVKDRRTQGLQGPASVAQALAQLLAGTGLTVEQGRSGYVVVPVQQDTRPHLLDPVTVRGQPGGANGVDPVDGYQAGYSRTATKTDTPVLETAQSISVVTADQIADRKATSVEEAVAYTAGVSVGGAGLDPRFDQINVRGYPATTNADFLDGLRQPNTGWLSYYTSEPYALERVEILKGPASVLYGQISPGGMVNRVSKRPSLSARKEVELQAGNNDHLQGQFDVGGKLDQNADVLYRLVGVARDAETDIEQVDNDITLLAPSLSWRIDDDTHLTLLAQYSDRLTSGAPRPYQQGDTLTRFWPGDEEFDKLDQRQWSLGYEFEHAFSDRVRFQHNLRYGNVDTTNQYLSVGTVDSSTPNLLPRSSYGVYEDMESVTSDTRLVTELNTGPVRHTLLTGIDYTWLNYDVVYASGPAPSIDITNPDYHQPVPNPTTGTVFTDQTGTSHRGGLYLMDQMALDNWRLSAGIRQDWSATDKKNHLAGSHDKSHNDKTTGQAGVLYLFDSGIAPYASYAQSFLPENGANLYGEDYKPTEGEQFELGVKYQPPGSRTLLTASVYQLTQTNVLTRDPDNALNHLQTGEERSRGVELEAVSDINEALRMTASYAFNDAEVTKSNDGDEGKDPINRPRHLASLWLEYRQYGGVLDGLGVAGGARYVGSNYSDSNNDDKNEAYTLVDLGAHYDLHGALAGFRIGVNAKNVFDKQYIACEAGYCYRGEGRSVIGSVSYRW